MQNTQRVDFSSDTASSVSNGLRVVVTGGTSGLGLALVRELRAYGARVARARHERARAVPAHSSTTRRIGRFGPRGSRRTRPQRFQ